MSACSHDTGAGQKWLHRLKSRTAASRHAQPAAAPFPGKVLPIAKAAPIDEAQQLHDLRVARFVELGVDATEASQLANSLADRDASGDYSDMVLCLECANCQRGKFCSRPAAAQIGRELGQIARMLQRCPAFRSQPIQP